jgi:riboflavin synthase
MFTGIIEEVGVIQTISRMAGRWEFAVRTSLGPAGIAAGDSVAVDGVCLTATRIEKGIFYADASLETLNVTTLKEKKTNDAVNIERAMRVDSRLGGHIVMGHVDGIGHIARIQKEGDSIRIDIDVSKEISRYIVKKGSVAVDGISLTVNEQNDTFFTVNVIPYSASKTTIGRKLQRDKVNVETDILGRYVERFIAGQKPGGIDVDFLSKHGYIKD